MHITESNHQHHHQHWPAAAVNAGDKNTIFSTMYKICILCLMETLKMIGETLINQGKTEEAAVKVSRPGRPSRTQSKVIHINKKWLKQTMRGQVNTEADCKAKDVRRTFSAIGRFHRRCPSGRRRNSYPPVQRPSHLECVVEEDLSEV